MQEKNDPRFLHERIVLRDLFGCCSGPTQNYQESHWVYEVFQLFLILGVSVQLLEALVEERSTLAFATKPVVGVTPQKTTSDTDVNVGQVWMEPV